jgi:elongation factor 2
MVHELEGKEYLVNLIDTPGHVDFGGDVTRAMRAIDGAIVVACAVEGVMPQTETVIRQAMRERVKPILFINKVDRMVKELKLTPDDMQARFIKIISKVNKLIAQFAPDEVKEEWQVNVNTGTVCFGSAVGNWAISVPYMQRTGITFKDIIQACSSDGQRELAKKSPLHVVLLNTVVRDLPSPMEAQKIRIPHIWKGDSESKIGKEMVACDADGTMAMVVTRILIDPHAGEVAVGRIFSGSVKQGQEVWISGLNKKARIQQAAVYMGPERVNMPSIPAGNILALTGIKDAIAGETIAGGDQAITPFEAIKHHSEPVVTVAIEAKSTKDLPKLIEVLRQMAKEYPEIQVEISEETGEHLLSGQGELHLEVLIHRIRTDKGVEVETSEPIVIYRETIGKFAGPIEGKSPNKHNRFQITVEPLEDEVYKAIKEGTIPEGRIRGRAMAPQFQEIGLPKEEARRVIDVYGDNIMIDATRGITYLPEIIELVIQAFEEAVEGGPTTREKVIKMKVKLLDAQIHEDPVHRGPAQVVPAVRSAIFACMLTGGAVVLEPKQFVFINVPQDFMGQATKEIQQRRGQVQDIRQEDGTIMVESKTPVSELFGFSGAIRSATEGRALWTTEFAGFERMPQDLQPEVVSTIRGRKGLKPQPPKVSDFVS